MAVSPWATIAKRCRPGCPPTGALLVPTPEKLVQATDAPANRRERQIGEVRTALAIQIPEDGTECCHHIDRQQHLAGGDDAVLGTADARANGEAVVLLRCGAVLDGNALEQLSDAAVGNADRLGDLFGG